MAINISNSPVNTTIGYSNGYQVPQGDSSSTGDAASPPSLTPEEIKKICSPPTVPLDAESTRHLAAYAAYNASLAALTQTFSMNDELAKQLGT